MVDIRRQFGNRGEDLAAEFLEKKGYVILERQYRCTYGEVDIVCRLEDEIIFVEVKSRHTNEYGYPEDSVTKTKRRHLQSVSEKYLESHFLTDHSWRVDVIAIEFNEGYPIFSHFEAIDV